MRRTIAAVRHHQQLQRLCGAIVRAVSGDSAVRFQGSRLHRDGTPVRLGAPHLIVSPDVDDVSYARGAADGLALRLLFSDDDIHQRLRPDDTVPRLLFDMLEQFRVESLAPARLPGVATNVRYRHEQWALTLHRNGLTDTAAGLLLYTVAQVCRSRVSGQPVVAETEDLIEATRFTVAPTLGHDVAGLRHSRADQAAYARHALSIALAVGDMIADDATVAQQKAVDDAQLSQLSLLHDSDVDIDAADAAISVGHGHAREHRHAAYGVFTTAYDVERRVSAVVREAECREYRQRLDQRVIAQSVNGAWLTRALEALLAEPSRTGWDSGHDEGRIDRGRLAQLIAAPGERRLFTAERVEPVADVLVTMLIDCSGSMKEHIETVASLVDVLARALERAGVGSEILGYTTGAWNGGRAQRDWRRARRPSHPGRLNEVCHLIVKDADTPYRRARLDIAGLMKADLFREGVDGEAVAWACRRMAGRSEKRRLLLVISDGSPMDTATALANGKHYLDSHLAETVAHEEARGSARIYGLGVGIDVSRYYRRSQVLDLSAGATTTVFREILALLARRP